MEAISIIGNKIGSLNFVDLGIKEVCIIHIINEYRPKGPAENSILILTIKTNGIKEAEYIPWVGYFDLDREELKYPNKWRIIDPSKKMNYTNVNWKPFGQDG